MQGHIFWHRLPRCYRGRDDGSNRPGWLATSLDRFLPVLRSFCFPGHPPLQHLQSLERVFQVARVLNLLPGGEGGCKVLQPEIDTRGGVRRERCRFRIRLPIIDREADKPFPCLRLETVAYLIFPGEDPSSSPVKIRWKMALTSPICGNLTLRYLKGLHRNEERNLLLSTTCCERYSFSVTGALISEGRRRFHPRTSRPGSSHSATSTPAR